MTRQEIDIFAARATLGTMWGLGRPLKAAELGRVLGFTTRDPGAEVKKMENGRPLSGPVILAMQLMLNGARPGDLEARLRPAPRS